jgi:fucose 4-O-acetylase-like acetyltransferase
MIFSCYRAVHEGPIPEQIMQSALVIELFHNVSLIIVAKLILVCILSRIRRQCACNSAILMAPLNSLGYSLFAGNHGPRLRFAMIGSRGFATRDNASMKMGSQALI